MRVQNFVIILTCISFSFFSCVSGPKKFKFDELSSKTFKLFRVTYVTMIEESDNAADLFVSLPIQNVVLEIETKYGVNIDTSLFSDIENNISQIKSYDLAIRNYFMQYETDDLQRVSITLNRLNQEELTIEVSFTIYEDGKISSRNYYTFDIPKL